MFFLETAANEADPDTFLCLRTRKAESIDAKKHTEPPLPPPHQPPPFSFPYTRRPVRPQELQTTMAYALFPDPHFSLMS